MDWLIELGNFFDENWKLISDNWGTFLLFALILIAGTVAITKSIVKSHYDSLPERIKLKEQVDLLTSENENLKEQVRHMQAAKKVVE